MVIDTTIRETMKLLPAICLCLTTGVLHAQKATETPAYSLFHPVPKDSMREDMETDRPDVTESPYTVDAGHFQLESDIFRYKYSGTDDALNRQYLFAPFTFKAGLSRSTDIQICLEAYRLEYHKENSDPETHYGNFGSLSLRLKRNIIGNDSGKFAVAVMPYIKLPAHAFFDHHKFEGGIIVPAQWKIAEKLSIGFQEEADLVAEEEDYEIQALQSVTLSYDILEQLKIIGETYYAYHFGEQEIENYVNCALQFFPVKNFAIDGGLLQGLQKGTEHHFYLGVAWRW